MPTFGTPGPITVVVDLPMADTRIVASDRQETVVDLLGDDDSTTIDFTGDRLTITAPAAKSGLLHWGLGLLGLGAGSGETVIVEVPTDSRLQVTTRYGSVSTEGRLGACRVRSDYGDVHLDHTGPLDLRCRHGEVWVGQVTGDAEIVASSGDTRVDAVRGTTAITNDNSDISVGVVTGPATLRSSHGETSVDRVLDGVTVRNAYGGVHIRELVAGACDLTTTYGEIDIGIAEGTAVWLDIGSDSGSVRNRLPEQPGPDAFERTAEIHARTRDGDVVVRRARPPKEERRWWKR
jgi:Toastrack DUF4097